MNLIKKVILIENVMCVYRNYSFLSKRMKILASLRIGLTMFFYLYAFAHNLQTLLKMFESLDIVDYCIVIIYNFLTILNTIAAIILGISNGQSFKKYVLGIDSVYKICSHDAKYLKALKKLTTRLFIIACLCAILGFVVVSVYTYDSRYRMSLSSSFLFDTIVDCFVHFRYISECFAFYAFIDIVVSSLHHLYWSVSASVLMLKDDAELVCGSDDFLKLGKELKRWKTATQHLANCSGQLKTCFGLQIALSLFSATTFFIGLLYKATCLLARKDVQQYTNNNSNRSGVIILFVVTYYMMIKILIFAGGQRARREVERLSAALAKLHVLLVGIPGSEAEECARTVVALTRQLRATPVTVRLCTGVAVQMSLLTDILTIVASYTIILLQFNHVV